MSTFSTGDGTALHVEESGRADAPVTVVLSHGWTLDARTWGPVADRIGAEARVIRYDHRGHGRSASAMIVMPPIECPAKTSGPAGARSARSSARSSASWSIVIDAGSAAAERPCPRWS